MLNEVDNRQQVLEYIREMSEAPVMSQVMARMLELSRRNPDEIRMGEIEDVVQSDPALVSKVLRIANSPYYGLKVEVTTIRQAVMTIGIQDLLRMALVSSLSERLRAHNATAEIDPMEFWRHSVATGAAARAAAAFVDSRALSRAEIGLVGLLHDLGKHVFIRRVPNDYDACITEARESGRELHEVELVRFGMAHDEAGGLLAANWELPEFLVQSIGRHHHPQDCVEEYRDAAALTQWADRLVRMQGIGASGASVPAPLDQDSETHAASRALDDRLLLFQDQILKAVNVDLALLADGAVANADPAGEAPVPPAPSASRPAPKPKGFLHRVKAMFR